LARNAKLGQAISALAVFDFADRFGRMGPASAEFVGVDRFAPARFRSGSTELACQSRESDTAKEFATSVAYA
jgi:hypothetical protein